MGTVARHGARLSLRARRPYGDGGARRRPSDPGLSPDVKAQMLPVLLLIHGAKGSTALLMERRTGALMGPPRYGASCVSIWCHADVICCGIRAYPFVYAVRTCAYSRAYPFAYSCVVC